MKYLFRCQHCGHEQWAEGEGKRAHLVDRWDTHRRVDLHWMQLVACEWPEDDGFPF